MRVVIRNGSVVTPQGIYPWDIVCEDDRIVGVETHGVSVPADQEIDASRLLVFPGFIDPHVHSRDPGLTEKEDFEHSTRAAAAGGVTTILEMPNAVPPVSDVDTFRERARQHEHVAFVDFGLWAIALGTSNLESLPSLIEEGAVGIKLFWGYALHRQTRQLVYNLQDELPENLLLPPGTGEVFDLFKTVARACGLLAAHCEDRGLIESAQRELGRDIRDYDDLVTTRPDTAEAAAIALGAEFSRATRCRFHVVHLSSARGVEIIRRAQQDSVPITAETCPQYLTLTHESYQSVGPLMKVYPPIRGAADQSALWGGIRDGVITSIGSDHAPHTIAEKQQDMARQPAGMIGVETLVPVMVNQALSGRISLQRLAWLLSEGTARLYGLYPRKGAIQPGADADFTLIDPEAEQVIRNEKLHSKNPLSPWHNCTLRGAPRLAVSRGTIVMRDGAPIGEPRGRLVRPVRTPQPVPA